MSLFLLKAMMGHKGANKGFFSRFGKGGTPFPKHNSRHRRSQMKAINNGRFSGKGAKFGL